VATTGVEEEFLISLGKGRPIIVTRGGYVTERGTNRRKERQGPISTDELKKAIRKSVSKRTQGRGRSLKFAGKNEGRSRKASKEVSVEKGHVLFARKSWPRNGRRGGGNPLTGGSNLVRRFFEFLGEKD